MWQVDDDIVFIKDGSFEHLVYQTLFNKDYLYYGGQVVNHPHSFAYQTLIHAIPPATFHFPDQRPANATPVDPFNPQLGRKLLLTQELWFDLKRYGL